MERMNPCPNGNPACTATLQHRVVQIRRGDRMVECQRLSWRCDACRDPLTGDPLQLIDPVLGVRNEQVARDAWRTRFGEELPAARRPGRKPGVIRDERVTVLMTRSELAEIDRLRGEMTRSDFIRDAVLRRRRAG